MKSLGIYPVGSLVKLSSRAFGRGGVSRQQVLDDASGKVFYPPSPICAMVPRSSICLHRADREDHQPEDPAKWRFSDLNALWSGQIAPQSFLRGRNLPSSHLAMALRCTSSGPSAKRSVRAWA